MFAPILNNLLVTATFFAFAALPGPTEPTVLGITTAQRYVLAIGTTAGVAAMTLALWPSLRRTGFRWRWTPDFRDAGVRRIVRLAGWALMYVIVNQLGYLLVIVLAAGVQGGYTAYAAAFIFFQLPHGIFAVSIITALLPSMASRWADGDRSGFRAKLSQGIRATALVVVPAAFGYLALSVPIVRLLLQHGVTSAQSTDLVAGILVFFSLGLLSFSTFQLFLRAFYAMQDTRTPALINVAAVGLNVVLNLVFFQFLRVRGLVLGHATAYTFAALASAAIIRRRLGGLDGRRILRSLAGLLVAGAATGGAAFVTARWVGGRLGTLTIGAQAAQVGAGMAAEIAAFVLISMAVRSDELSMVRGLLAGRFGRT
jgi:putative peptidoglycan lipid II flippase